MRLESDRKGIRAAAGVISCYLLFVQAVSATPSGAEGRDSQLWIIDRVLNLNRAGDVAGLKSFSDSLQAAGGCEVERRACSLLEAIVLRRSGKASEAYAVLDDLATDAAGESDLFLFVFALESSKALKSLSIPEPAMRWAQRALATAERRGDSYGLAETHVLMAAIHRQMGELQAGLEALISAERIARDNGIEALLCSIALDRGNVYYHQNRNNEAIEQYTFARECAMGRNDAANVATAVLNLASAHFNAMDTTAALALYEEALRYPAIASDLGLEADLRTNRASLYEQIGDPKRSLSEITTAMRIRQDIGDTAGLYYCYSVLASIKHGVGEYDSAFHYQMKADRCAEAAGSLNDISESKLLLSEYAASLGNMVDAYDFRVIHERLDDSLDLVTQGEQIHRIEIQYETEKKEQMIKVQQLELRTKEAEIDRKRAQQRYMLGALVLLVAAGALLVRNIAHKRSLAEQRRVIAEQRVDEVMRTQELKMVSAMVEGQETERKRIAKELHDRLGSMLSAVRLRFSALEGWVSGQVKEQQDQFGTLFSLLDSAVIEVRRVSHDMAHSTVGEFGLVHALEELRESIDVPGKLETELSIFGMDRRLDPRQEIGIFRIVQELVSNVLKHAQATQVTIQLTRDNGSLNVMVSDNGIGFDPSAHADGIGLQNVRDRVAELNGTINVDPVQGRGTTVSIDIAIS